VTSVKLRDRGIQTVGDVASLEQRALVSMLGPASGRHLHALANNYDPRVVHVGRRRRSIGAQRALGRRRLSSAELDATLAGQVDRVARRLRTGDRLCRTVVLRLRFDDFTRATRSHTLPMPTNQTEALLGALRGLLAGVGPKIATDGLTLIGISLANLDDTDAMQLELPFGERSTVGLDSAVDRIRDRYGTASIMRAALLGRDPGVLMPILPE
jgi:DNA polymerase-4